MSLRLLYLIVQKVLGLILLLGRTSTSKDVEEGATLSSYNHHLTADDCVS